MTKTLIIAFVFALAADLASAADRKPNVILIMADDLGYETITANGGESYQTPNLDKLAATGMRFENCHVQPLCTPTRVQLMTGMSNARNYTHFGELEPSQVTFGNLLKRAGYATCIAGKWQLGRDFALPGKFGFDEYCLWQLTRRPDRYKNPGLEINGKEIDYTKGEYGPDIVNDYALDFIARKKAEPFFLYYPMMLTHSPYDPTPDSADYAGGTGKKRKGGGHFGDMVAYMDKLIGKLVAKLDETGVRDNTLILFLGDNGTGKGTPLKFKGRAVVGAKSLTNTYGTHVPLIANWPAVMPKGRVSADLIDSTDFLPTICEAATAPVPADLKIDGRSFMPQLRGEKGTPREWLYAWYNPSGGPKAQAEFAHDARFKLYSDGRFFDVQADELEKRPLADDGLTAEAKAAKAKLQGALDQFKDARPAAIAKQGQAFGGEGDSAKKKKKAK
jgi:arylsulfatase A